MASEELDEACWKGYHKEGNKKMFGKRYPNCVKNEDVAEGLNEGIGGNYLYHATGAGGLKGILSSGSIRSATGPQATTRAQTKLPTVSVTRDWGYASGSNASKQMAEIGRDAILVLDRNTIESNFKTLGTSQSTIIKGLSFNPYLKKDGEARSQNTDPMARDNAKGKMKYAEPTAKAGGEFEEAVVVPKGVLPLKGTMVGFWINPKSELINDPAIMNDPRRLDMIRPNQFVKAKQTQDVAEGSEQKYLWHGSRQKIPMLEPRQSVDTGGAAGSNQNAIYATSDPKVAIAMGLTTPGSDTGMFPNDPQMVLFKGNIRKGENVYLHKVPFNGPDGKPQFVQGGNSREFHTIPGVKGIKPVEIKAVPVDKYLNLIRPATPADLELQKKYMQEGVAEAHHGESCPHCGGPMFSEEMINEKKDACYYKVKSRYKVWPSAYASGALVKCRKKGASNWGNSTKNESSILEGLEQTDENLHKWFKEKWVRFGPDGKIRGNCARGDDSEGKPKCLPQSKAQNLGKKGRASAAARKRREDPNPERSGKAINVATKKKTSESSILQGIDETKGLPMPSSYEQENKPFLRKGGQKIMSLTTEQELEEKWSNKYKKSIDCSHPKGFSQRAHCQGKKKK
jgi:hypothetical protein